MNKTNGQVHDFVLRPISVGVGVGEDAFFFLPQIILRKVKAAPKRMEGEV